MRVSLTGKAAYHIGGPTPSRTEWETIECACSLCASGRFVALDEVLEGYGQRHILRANLREFLPFGTDAFPPATAYSAMGTVGRKGRNRDPAEKSSSPRRKRRSPST